MKQKKCKYCLQYDDVENLDSFPQLDKNGTPKLTSNFRPLVWYAHRVCRERAECEKQQRNNLYDYVLAKYFVKFVPPLFLQGVQELRKLYTFEQQMNCLIHCENEIAQCKVQDTTHLCRLLIWFIKQNIVDYVALEEQTKAMSENIEEMKIVTVKRVEDKNEVLPKYDDIL